jgi:hypothetical protein
MPSNDINSIQFDVEEIRDANGFVVAIVTHNSIVSYNPDPHRIVVNREAIRLAEWSAYQTAREIGLDPRKPSSEPPEAINGLPYRFVPKDEEPIEQLAWNKERKITLDL